MSRGVNRFVHDLLAADDEILRLCGDPLNVSVAQPEQRATLNPDMPAMVVVREESTAHESEGNQLGIRVLTVYVEARAWTKDTVWQLKARIEAVLADATGATEDAEVVMRCRMDWDHGPFLNDDGLTWESQTRFLIRHTAA